jgi:hypothetical protein
MFAAFKGHYLQFVIFMGLSEQYPEWFIEEVSNRAFVDESRFCFWVPPQERSPDYHEKQLIETYSVVVRKYNGDIHLLDTDTFNEMYTIFEYDQFLNGGVAAFNEDIIEYTTCVGGSPVDRYPAWFYEYFTEALNNPKDGETYLFSVDGLGNITVKEERCVFLRNRFGEIRYVSYGNFLKYYDPRVDDAKYYKLRTDHEYLLEDCPF